ncbi:hypothetical protein FRC10_004037, partial [Ceratobasidium sp. 414]
RMRLELVEHKLAEELIGVLRRQKPAEGNPELELQLTEERSAAFISKAVESTVQQIAKHDDIKQHMLSSDAEDQLSRIITPPQLQPAP